MCRGIAAFSIQATQNQAVPCPPFDDRLFSSAMNTRRQFLITAPMAVLVTATACRQQTPTTNSQSTPTTAGAPPTFGTGAGAGPPVTPETFAEAEKLMQVTLTPAE